MHPSLVIFDCDGVLVDSEIVSNSIFVEMISERGADTTVQRVLSELVGKTDADIGGAIQEIYGIDVRPDFVAEANRRLRAAYLTELQPIDGVRELVARLPMPFAVASNSPPSKLGLGLSVTNLFETFYPHIYCAKLVARGKPAPDLFLHVANAFDVAPRSVMVIEDSVSGITAAKAANMFAVGFIGGRHQGPDAADRLRQAGADVVVASMTEVGDLLKLAS